MDTTALGIFIIVGIIFIYDGYLLMFKGYEATISWTLYTWALKFPVIPFLIGFVMGHLFWPVYVGSAIVP